MANNNRVTKGLKDIADAIRAKTGDDSKMTAAEMPEKIEAIPVGIDPEGTKEISANGEFNVREFESVNVNVPNPSTGTLEINENGEYDVTEKAAVNVAVAGVQPSGTYHISTSDLGDTIDISDYAEADVPDIDDFCDKGTKQISYGSGSRYAYESIAGYSHVNIS